MRKRYLRGSTSKKRRGFAVYADGIAEKFLHPRRMGSFGGGRIGQRTVGGETTVLDHQRNLVRAAR